ncbi:MAG TPA: succinate dehydrogenase, hydrophobic membrane anchor protein [Porticoccaceae bacterium]|jgi:succinate dehydrogenase / fumarate reductase membrane anchor subunit|nr:succinate dehydrogenase, hydrophobic membrane anchor protein [Porticoccaceae bacterium]
MAVKPVTSFGRSGLSDWLMQRISAVIIAVYTLVMVGYLATHAELSYAQWAALHQQFWVRLLTLFTVLAIAAHAWIGIWAVLTDYVTVRLLGPIATPLRLVLVLGAIALILAYVVWAIDILWGV